MQSSSLLASFGHADLSPASTASPLITRVDHDGKQKQRLLRQARKLSQILGELPRAMVAPPSHPAPVRDIASAVEVSPTGLSQRHVPTSGRSFAEPWSHPPRLSLTFQTVAASPMSPNPSLISFVRDDSNPTGTQRHSPIIPAHMNQLDSTRFGLDHRHPLGSVTC